jgi:hypothetical protein
MVDEENAAPSMAKSDVDFDGATKAAVELTTEKTTKDPNVVDFDEDDPENPMNWPGGRKMSAIVIITTLTLVS